MRTITGGGVFSRQNISDINANFSELDVSSPATVDVWVRPQYGNDNNVGSYAKPFATMSGCSRAIEPGIVIGVEGVLKEEYTGPIVNDVTIIGAKSNQPRQATTSGTPNGGGATWLSPAGGTGTLLKIKGQAWRVQNVFFNNSATNAPCIDLLLEGDPPTDADAGHSQIVGCVFTGTDDGIWLTGGVSFITIAGCRFFNFAGSGDTAIKAVAGLGIGTNWGYTIVNNEFYDNVNHIVAPLHNATLTGNTIMVKGLVVATTTVAVDFTNGAGNTVMGNYLGDNLTGAEATWTGGTNDKWCNFTADDGVGSGVPA